MSVGGFMQLWKPVLVLLSLLSLIACGGGGGGGDQQPVDSTAPAVSIATPVAGATVNGVVTGSATASDNIGVSKVEFYVNGLLQSTDLAAPFSFDWNTALLPDGPQTITAKAYDAAGNSATSSAVTVTTSNDSTTPAVAITAPANGGTVTGTVDISASASDNVAVSRVDFYANGALLGSDSTAPYSYSWDTAHVAGGSYTLSAKAYDAADNMQQSSDVVVTVPVSLSQSVVFGSGSAVGTVFIAGLPAPGAYNLNVTVTMPAGTTIQSAALSPDFAFGDWLVGVNGGLVVAAFVFSPSNPSYVGTGDFLTLNFGNVPAGTVAGDFGVTLQGVWDGNDTQIQ